MTQINLLNLTSSGAPDAGRRADLNRGSSEISFQNFLASGGSSQSRESSLNRADRRSEPAAREDDDDTSPDDWGALHAAAHQSDASNDPVERVDAADGDRVSTVTATTKDARSLAEQKAAQADSNSTDSQTAGDSAVDEGLAAEAVDSDVRVSLEGGLPEGVVANDVEESTLVAARPIASSRNQAPQSKLEDAEAEADGLEHSKQNPDSVSEPEAMDFKSSSDGDIGTSRSNHGSSSQLKPESGFRPDGGVLDGPTTIESGPTSPSPSTSAMGGLTGGAGVWNQSTGGHGSSVATHVVQVPMAQMVDQIPELVFAEVSSLDDGQATELRIQVEPADMGTLDIQVRMDADRLHAHIVASEMTTSDLLTRDRQHLVQTLQDMGLDVSQFDISHRHDSEFRDSQQGSRHPGGGAAAPGPVDSSVREGKAPRAKSSNAIDIIA